MLSKGGWNRLAVAAVVGLLAVTGQVVAQQPGSQPVLPPLSTPNLPPTIVPPPSVAPAVEVPLPSQPPAPPVSAPPGAGFQPGPRFSFKIDPNTPVKDLLPVAPKPAAGRGPVLTDDLAKVPEAEFQAKPESNPVPGKMAEQTAHQLAKINHANARKSDAFMAALLESRPDLAGLPFVMGDDCRTSGERTRQFTLAVSTVRQALPNGNQVVIAGGLTGVAQAPAGSQPFWPLFTRLCDQQDGARPKSDKALAEHATVARIAALMQMLAAEPAETRAGLVKYLSATSHVEATRALARMAIFSAEDEVRHAAADALKVRREKDYTDILVKGLRYPWPAVARRSAEAIARIGRTDLVPELVAVLDADDPRMPQKKMTGWTEVTTVREMVRVNHHRNCALCHAPAGSTGVVPASALTAEVPIPGQPMASPSQYSGSTPELMVRVDVTYLRQDFSVMLAVGDAHPWPEAQRFDFLVRERRVSPEEAAAYREKLSPKEDGVLSPYHKAALCALRDLTGKDTSPTAQAWRALLKLPAKPGASGR